MQKFGGGHRKVGSAETLCNINKNIDFQVCILKNKVVDDINAQWGDSGSTNWGAPEVNQNWQNNDTSAMTSQYEDASQVEGNYLLPLFREQEN